MGTELVALAAATVVTWPPVRMTSTPVRTSSCASAVSRSDVRSAPE